MQTMIIFRDERTLLRHPLFIVGSVIVFAGSVGFSLAGLSQSTAGTYVSGILFLTFSMLSNCCMGLIQKHLVKQCKPLPLAALNAIGMSVVLFTFMILRGWDGGITQAPLHLSLLLLASGVWGLMIGMLLALLVISRIGLVRFRLIRLVVPVMVGAAAWFLFGERMSGSQILFALVLVSGAALTMVTGRRQSPSPGTVGVSVARPG